MADMSFYRSQLFSEDQCLEHLFRLRFQNPQCKACGRRNAFHRNRVKQCFTCNCGKTHIFPRKGTIFGSSHLPLLTWIHAIFLLTRSKKVMTIQELAEYLSIAYPTAWRMKTMITDLLGADRIGSGRQMDFLGAMKKCATTEFA